MKKCPYCAEEIQDEAIVCRYCGRDLPQKSIAAQTSVVSRGKKKPWLAVLLNCFILIMGIGYIYIGLWSRFLLVFILQLFTAWPMTWLGLREYNKYLLACIWIITLFDVHSQAKRVNEKGQVSA